MNRSGFGRFRPRDISDAPDRYARNARAGSSCLVLKIDPALPSVTIASVEPITYAVHAAGGRDIGGQLFSIDEIRRVVAEYRDEHGEQAAIRDLTIMKMTERSGVGQRLDVHDFL